MDYLTLLNEMRTCRELYRNADENYWNRHWQIEDMEVQLMHAKERKAKALKIRESHLQEYEEAKAAFEAYTQQTEESS